jgi:hypothetical protein
VGLTIQEKIVASEVFIFATEKYALPQVLYNWNLLRVSNTEQDTVGLYNMQKEILVVTVNFETSLRI